MTMFSERFFVTECITLDLLSVLSVQRFQGSSTSVQDIIGKHPLSRELVNSKSTSTQVQRLHQEWAAIDHCRAMKRASEVRLVVGVGQHGLWQVDTGVRDVSILLVVSILPINTGV